MYPFDRIKNKQNFKCNRQKESGELMLEISIIYSMLHVTLTLAPAH